LGSAGAAISGHEDELAHLRVIMPFHGVLTKRLVEPGESVVPGQIVAEVMTLDSLDVHAPLDERDAAEVRVGQPVRVTLDPFPGVTWDAHVTRVAPVVEETREQNRTLTIEAQLNPVAGDSRPRPGMSADLEVILAQRDDVLRVPSAAVIDGKRVLVLKGGRAVAREVGTGARNWDWTEVVSGLKAGEPVIVSLDRTGVVAGARVRAERKPAAGAPARDTSSAAASRAARPGGLAERPR
jgi:HlyD family secretion protein